MPRLVRFFLIVSLMTSSSIAQTLVSGRLTGQDGKVLPAANVFLERGNSASAKSVAADKDGKYSLTIDSSGVWVLRFAGVNHYSHDVMLFVGTESKISLDVELEGYEYADDFTALKVVGDFNGFSFQTGVPMRRDSAGKYFADVRTSADTLTYQIIGLEATGRSVNGTMAEKYYYDGGGDYLSVIKPVNGTAHIELDPSLLSRSPGEVSVRFGNTSDRFAKMSAINEQFHREVNDVEKARQAFLKSGKDVKEFKYASPEEIAVAEAQLKQESDPLVRQGLLISLLGLEFLQNSPDSSVMTKVMDNVPPSSIAWSLNPDLILTLAMSGEKGSKYMDEYIRSNLDNSAIANVVFNEFIDAKYDNKKEEAAKYYDILVNQLGSTPQGKKVKARYVREGNIGIGVPVPAFRVTSMEDSTVAITNETLKGKTYIIDFWATWCGPCVGEMKNLHDAYAKYKSRGFEILSLSLDNSPADVVAFRKNKWPMPWLHAFLGDWENKVCKDFDVVAIPRPVLVDSTGKIVAMNTELRGEELEKTLERVLGK